MPQSLAQIYLHIVFSTKHRQPFLRDKAVRDEMHTYLGGTCRNLDSPALIVGGVSDHVHLLCRLGKTWAPSELVRELKRESSKWAKDRASEPSFYWQDGYGAFSVGACELNAVRAYIADQEAHHATESFQDELRTICAETGTPYDERYVWD